MTTVLCPNCGSDKHARCCSWCGQIHKPHRRDTERCSAKCDRAAANADKISEAMEDDHEAHH